MDEKSLQCFMMAEQRRPTNPPELFSPVGAAEELRAIYERRRRLGPLRDALMDGIRRVTDTYPIDHGTDRQEDYWGFRRDTSLLAQTESRDIDPLRSSLVTEALGRRDGVEIDPLQYLVIKAEQLSRAVAVAATLEPVLAADSVREREILAAFREEAVGRIQSAQAEAMAAVARLGNEELTHNMAIWFGIALHEVEQSQVHAAHRSRGMREIRSYGTVTESDAARLSRYGGDGRQRVTIESLPPALNEEDTQELELMKDLLGEAITADHVMTPKQIAYQAVQDLLASQHKTKTGIPRSFWQGRLLAMAQVFERAVAAQWEEDPTGTTTGKLAPPSEKDTTQ